jgi:ABC-type nitrate/sulfonate/bicarbonate transport system permease component
MVMTVKEIDSRLIETAYTMGMTKFQVITKVVLPYTLPSICKSILMMYGIGWSYIVAAETTNTNVGLGYIINIGSARGRTDMVFMSILIIMAISYILDALGNYFITKKFSWKFKKVDENINS